MPKPNESILREVNDARLWFHAKKTRPIWGRLLVQPETVKTLEGDEQVPAGNYLCRGEAGDIWPQTPERLADKYQAVDEIDSDGWQKFLPQPGDRGVKAAQISHAFTVQAQWGELRGKPGDFLVTNYEGQTVEYPDDVWIIDQQLFVATYERVIQSS